MKRVSRQHEATYSEVKRLLMELPFYWLNSNLDRINSKIIYRDVTITGDSIKPGGDISLFCDIPSGYTPLSVEDISSSMVINGMLSSVGIYAGRAITRFHNLSSSYVSIANQVLRFWFIYNS